MTQPPALLVIDVGNTHAVIGLYRDEVLQAHWRLSSKTPRTEDEMWNHLRLWTEEAGFSAKQIGGVVISSVVPAIQSVLIRMSREKLNLEPLVVSADLPLDMSILYEPASAVGADRICNAVAGFHRYGGPLIVVDFGTATTFDVVSASGDYLGGVIALGLMGASEELHRISAKLPRVALDFPGSVVGKTTEASMQSGILWGTLAMVDGMVRRIKKELGAPNAVVVGTGGIARIFHDKSEEIQYVAPFLTLDGMRIIYNHVRSSR